MKQKTIIKGKQLTIHSKSAITENLIFFKDNESHIAIAIEDTITKEANYYFVYKNNAKLLVEWLQEHI